MSETAADVKETQTTTSPEKKEVCEKKSAPVEEKETKKEQNGDEKKEQNGDAKSKNGVEESEEKPVQNGDSEDVCSLPQKRKSEAGGDAADAPTSRAEGVSPEKKAKLEEKVENGEAEATV